MNAIFLPGNSPINKEWIEDLEKSLKPLLGSTLIQYYEHWKTGDSIMDFEYEYAKLVKECEGLGKFAVVGKSAGALLAAKAIYDHKIFPSKCVFIGTAIMWGRANSYDVDLWFDNLTVPSLFIQQTDDPAMPFSELEIFLRDSGVTSYNLKEVPGNDHAYLDLETINKYVSDFLNPQMITFEV
jgi:hypothetical protein